MINFFRVGVITSLRGLHGEFKCIVTSSDPNRFDSLKKIYIVNKNQYEDFLKNENLYIHTIENIKYINKKIIISIKNINTIDEAKKYINSDIYIDRKIAIPLKENEFFIPDLINISVYTTDDKFIGKVIDVDLSSKDAILVVDRNNKEVLIPMNKYFIKNIDIKNSKIEVNLLKGMIEDDI